MITLSIIEHRGTERQSSFGTDSADYTDFIFYKNINNPCQCRQSFRPSQCFK